MATEEEIEDEIKDLELKLKKKLYLTTRINRDIRLSEKEYEDWKHLEPSDEIRKRIDNLKAELKGMKQARQDERKKCIEEVKSIMYGKIDWFKVFKDAYESRKTAWYELGHIQEWRNATDEILFATWHQLEFHLNLIPNYQDDEIINNFKKSQEDAEDFRKNKLPSISPKKNQIPKNQGEKLR